MWFLKPRKTLRKRRARPRSGRADYLRHKESARSLAQTLVAEWAPRIGVNPGRIAIRDQRSRWGSCSTKGNLNFNYRITLIPYELVEYIVVHELCHLHEFNHSERFWSHVALHMPDFALRKHALAVSTRLLSAPEKRGSHTQRAMYTTPVSE